MFRTESSGDSKCLLIVDDHSDMLLELDTDDVNPEDVSDENVLRIVGALNQEFYGRPNMVRAALERAWSALDVGHDHTTETLEDMKRLGR